MARKPRVEGYSVWMQLNMKPRNSEPGGLIWVARTSRRGTCELEMAEALTHDLSRMGVKWEIRNQDGEVVQSSERDVPEGLWKREPIGDLQP